MKLILEEAIREKAIRVDLAWTLFFEKPTIPEGHGGRLIPFTNWLWDELGKKAGNLNRNSSSELTLTIPSLSEQGMDFLLRLASFWSNEIYLKKDGVLSENLWRKPVINVFDDTRLDGSERSLTRKREGYYTRFLMPLLGESSARLHSHSEVDEYYLILEGSGTLRFNDKEIAVHRGDLIGKPTGPDDASQLIADQGEALRILDMEVWHDRPDNSKDLIHNPDFNEIFMRGRGWGALVPADALLNPSDFGQYYSESYKRTKDGGWVPSKARGHKKIRAKSPSDSKGSEK